MLFAAEGLGQRTVGSKGVKLIVAVAGLSRGVGQFLKTGLVSGNKAIVVGERVTAIKSPAIHRGVTYRFPMGK